MQKMRMYPSIHAANLICCTCDLILKCLRLFFLRKKPLLFMNFLLKLIFVKLSKYLIIAFFVVLAAFCGLIYLYARYQYFRGYAHSAERR